MDIDKYIFINYYAMNKKLDVTNMLTFLQDFDCLEGKYAVVKDEKSKKNLGLRSLFIGNSLPLDVRAEAALYESAYGFGDLNKQEYSYISENLSLVYGDADIVRNDILTYHLAEKKFIRDYLSIPQLERMFDEDYFNFEWDMHVGQNFSEHRNDYNRDHITHQIRNMHMMLVLLKWFNFYDASYDILIDARSGKISEYASKMLKQFLNNQNSSVFCLLKRIVNKVNKTANADVVNTYATDYFMKYIIYASAILSALFHDMGYPICHFLEQRQRVSEYNPTMYMFTHNTFDSFDKIEALLQNSLLFKIVSITELKKSMQINEKKGKYNHGAYSAIAFLLQFYNNGIIHSLSLEKQCAIEMAAVAIYNHTVKYKVSNEKEDTNYYQPVFRQNPVSFLLRLCDDLQEWDRRYFEISRSPDLSVCNKCLGILVPELVLDDSQEDKTSYRCFCNEESCFRNESFKKRRLYVVNTAKSLDVECNESVLSFYIDYDLYSLLKMSRVNNTYAKFRLNELNEIKQILRYQDFDFQSQTGLKFQRMYIDYFMTANPITIKIKILEKFIFDVLNLDVSDDKIEEILRTIELKDVFNTGFSSVFTDKHKPSLNDFIANNNNLYSVMNSGCFNFYKELLIWSLKCRKNGCRSILKEDEFKDEIIDELDNLINKFAPDSMMQLYRDTIKFLVLDCIYQYSKERGDIEAIEFVNRNEYYEQYVPHKSMEKQLYNYIGIYCDYNNKFNKCNEKVVDENGDEHYYVGYYQDLFFFDQLNRVIMKEKYPEKSE